MNSSFKSILRYLIFMVVLLATIYFLFMIREVLATFVLGAFLAYIFFRPVSMLENLGIPRIWSIIILYIILAFIIAILLALTIPGVVKEFTELGALIPEYAEEVGDLTSKIDDMDMPDKLNVIVKDNVSKIELFIYASLQKFFDILYNLLGKVLALVFSPILAFYIILDWEKIKSNFLNLFAPRTRRELINLFNELDTVLIEFLKGYLLVATIVGVLTGLTALFLGVKFPLILGVLSGVTNLIPFFGGFLGGIPAVAVAFSESTRLAIYMALGIFLVQQIESNLITPNVIGHKLGLHPLVIVFALLAGGKLLGIWGMIIAVPLVATAKVLLWFLYLKLVEP
ncbi:MAG: AI-2E family transporter [Syntrophomonadaceae bacterium]|nr:AI-2E family transporter [Syntrophomonadaceae bacterium]